MEDTCDSESIPPDRDNNRRSASNSNPPFVITRPFTSIGAQASNPTNTIYNNSFTGCNPNPYSPAPSAAKFKTLLPKEANEAGLSYTYSDLTYPSPGASITRIAANQPPKFQSQIGSSENHIPLPNIHHESLSPTSSINPLTAHHWHPSLSYRHKVRQPPHIPPSTDLTITLVSQHSEFWVAQISQALINTNSIKDRQTSHAARLFSPSTCDPFLIESTARAILIALLDRCIYGFRALSAFNKALGKGKECESDRKVNCRERLENVITALTWNKRICKDVLWEDWKIRLLVNHPLSYDREKDLQMGSNEQRRVRMEGEREKLKLMEDRLRDDHQCQLPSGSGLQSKVSVLPGGAIQSSEASHKGNAKRSYASIDEFGDKRVTLSKRHRVEM